MVTLETAAVLALVAASVGFTLVAVVGFYRLPDVYARAHAASKSETLGALLAIAAAAVAFGPGETPKLAMLALFVLVTGPTAAHAVARSAADAGIEPWVRGPVLPDGGVGPAVPDGGTKRSDDVAGASDHVTAGPSHGTEGGR